MTGGPLWLAIVILAGVIVWTRHITVGGFGWSDAPLHAMDGVIIHDLIRDFPDQPLQSWAIHYYAKLPCLGLVVYYPPLFAVVEAGMFLVFGISAAVARMTVVVFGLVGLFAMYWIARQILDRHAAVFTAALWASLPATVLWSRQVMLEVPAMALVMVCCGLYLKFRSTRRAGWLWAAAAALVLAVLTKQTAVFIAAVILVDMLITLGWKKSVNGQNLIIAAVTAGIILGYLLFASRYGKLSHQLVSGERWTHLLTVRNWTYYPAALPELLGWPALAFAGIGLLITAAVRTIRQIRLPIIWAAVFYVFAGVIAYKEPRYLYFITPPAAICIAAGLSAAVKPAAMKRSCHALLAVLICWQFLDAWRADPRRPADYQPAAQWIADAEPADHVKLVQVDAVRDGQYIFDLRRAQGRDGKCYVLRGSKLLYSRAARIRWGYTEYVKTPADVLALIDTYGLRYIIVESNPPNVPDWQAYFPPPSVLLRQVLRDGSRFKQIATYPIAGQANPIWKDVTLQIYENRRPASRKTNHVTIPVPAMEKILKIPLPER